MTNNDIAKHLDEIAFFYKQEGSNFKANAYTKVSLAVSGSSPLEFENGRLKTKLTGVGKSIQKTIEEFYNTGTSAKFDKFTQDGYAPPSVQTLERIPGVGAKTAKRMWEKFKITSIEEFGKNKQQLVGTDFEKYIDSYEQIKNASERIPYFDVLRVIDPLLNPLKDQGLDIGYAGSMRRGRESVRDIDIILCETEPGQRKTLREHLEQYGLEPNVRDGEEKIGVDVPVLDQLITMDINFCTPENRAAYYLYLTGSKNFNISMRKQFKERGMLLNQHGLYNNDNELIETKQEQDFFDILGVPFVPPECREDDALGKDFSNLVTHEDIIIDLHTHTVDSDGQCTWDQMVCSAQEEGLKVLGLSDHSSGSGNGLKEDEKLVRIEDFRKQQFPIRVLYGSEIDVRVSGELDYGLETILKMDYCLLALHHGYNKNVEERLIKNMELLKDFPTIIAHASGRRIGKKLPAEADWDLIFKKCVETNTILEINAQPDRLCLPPELVRRGLKAGVYFIIGTDTHNNSFRPLIEIGTNSARRGWLMKDRCVNCSEELLDKWLMGQLYGD